MIKPALSKLQNIFPKFQNTHLITHCSLSLQKMSGAKWKLEKNRLLLLNIPLQEKRKQYRCKEYVTADQVPMWNQYVVQNKYVEQFKHTLDDLTEFKKIKIDKDRNRDVNQRVSLFKGDITKLEIDAIVNAANSRLKAGGGVDGAIHRAAGSLLQDECDTLGGCPVGEAKMTGGYDLPAKYVIHTVGPQDGSVPALESCYKNCLSLVAENKLETVAFPCISTGIYGFPNRLAAHIALAAARKFLEANADVERIIFCTFLPVDVEIYETLMQMYFPLHDWNYNEGASVTE